MTERKFFAANASFGYHEEHDPTTDTLTLAGLAVNGTLAMANHRITGIPTTPTANTDAVNQSYVDSLVSGLGWKTPVDVFGLIGNANVATIDALGAVAGAAYVVTDAGTLTRGTVAVVAGDLVQDNGTDWVLVVAAVGGYVPAGTRAILAKTVALITPYTEASDDGKIMSFTGASNTGVSTGEAVNGAAVLVSGTGGYYDNEGFTYHGSVPTGDWIKFSGAGQINAGDGLTKTNNTLNVLPGNGVEIDTDHVAVNIEDTYPGLKFVGITNHIKTLDVNLKANSGLDKDANGIFVKIDDTPDTLDVDLDGLKVVGLPSLFKINDSAVSSAVTAANLGTLTAGSSSNADLLHTHAITGVEEAARVENTIVNSTSITAGKVVRYSAVNNQIAVADNDTDPHARVIGIARVGGAASPGTSEIVSHGLCATALTGMTVNTPVFLGTAGALVEHANIPRPGRIIRMGFMVNASDVFVQIMDLGYRAA